MQRGNNTAWMRVGALCWGLCLASLVHAGSFDLTDDLHADYKLTLGYALAMRMNDPANDLINGPVDPLQLAILPASSPSQIIGFGHTGLPTTINFDDGDRNFRKYSLINNRVNAYGEFSLKTDHYGAVFSGSAFHDWAYRSSNDNDSAPFGPGSTVNKMGAPNQFTDETRHYDGQRARMLDAYVYADWAIGDETNLSIRLGQQLVAWGESLFFSGIASTQGPADATKAFVPGSEIKDILLPVNQVAMQLSLSSDLTLLGQYKLAFKPTEIFPVGDYFSPADAVGPGATFVYGSINPLYLNGCQGLVSSALNTLLPGTNTLLGGLGINADSLCNQNGIGASLFGSSPYILAMRGPDINPSPYGQWGTGLRYQATSSTNLGLFYLRYHDTNPAVVLNVGYAPFTSSLLNILPLPLSTGAIAQYVPTSYNVKYYDGIHLIGSSFSTVLGPFNVAGELNYRDGLDMPVTATISGVVSPVYTRGRLGQALVSALYSVNPGLLVDDLTAVGEAGYIHVYGVERVASSPGINVHGKGDQLFYDKDSYGFQLLFLSSNHNVFSGWDLKNQLTYGEITQGNPSMAGAFGPLYGEGDRRLSLGTKLVYLSNLELGLGYNFFFGDTQKTIGTSALKANPYADRDYATFNIKYNL
jgi:hypothetical protein